MISVGTVKALFSSNLCDELRPSFTSSMGFVSNMPADTALDYMSFPHPGADEDYGPASIEDLIGGLNLTLFLYFKSSNYIKFQILCNFEIISNIYKV